MMKAVVVEKPEKITVVERDIPEITDNQVLLKVKAAGICGSDVGIYHGKNAFATYPRVVGHEFVGEVVKVGSKVLMQWLAIILPWILLFPVAIAMLVKLIGIMFANH